MRKSIRGLRRGINHPSSDLVDISLFSIVPLFHSLITAHDLFYSSLGNFADDFFESIESWMLPARRTALTPAPIFREKLLPSLREFNTRLRALNREYETARQPIQYICCF